MATITIKQARQIAKEKNVTIRGNGAAIPFVYWHELTPKEQKEFDYLDTPDAQADATFFRYKAWVYNLSDFERVEGHSDYMRAFDGYRGDSFFSGVGIVLDPDGDFIRAYTIIV